MVKLSKYEKIATAIVWLVYFVYGIATSLMNTTIIDLTEILQTDVSTVSYGLLSRAVFHCIGAPLFGWTFTLFSREFQYALSLALFGLGTCFTASSKTFTTFIVFNSLAGLATSGVDIASYVILLEIYKENANPYLQAMGGFWGLGQILAPLITRPFLSSDETFETGNTTITKHIPTSIQIPYNVLGIACVVVGGFVMIFTCFYESQKSKSSDHSPKTKVEPDLASRSSSLSASFRENIGKHPIKREDSFLLPKKLPKGYYITIVLLAAILVNFQIGLDLDFFNFLHTYAVEGPTKITKSDASYLVSLCGFVQLASRFVSIFISIYVRPGTIISISSLITLAAVISLIFTGTTITGLWTGAIILSIGLAPIGSSIYAYLEERMTVTSTIAAILSFSSTILSTSGPYIVGNAISTDPFVFILYILICNVSVIIMYIMLVIAEVWRRRYLEKQKNLNTVFNNRPNYISKP